MPEENRKTVKRSKKRLIFKAVLVSLFFVILFTLTMLAALPHLVSTQYVKSLVENAASRSVEREIRMDRIGFKWTQGIFIEGLRLSDDAAFSTSPMGTIRSIHLRMNFLKVLTGRLNRAVLDIEGVSLHLIRNTEGATNLNLLVSSIKKEKKLPIQEKKSKNEKLLFMPPLIGANVTIRDLFIGIDDRMQHRQIKFHRGFVNLDLPSVNHPLTLSVSSQVSLGNLSLPEVKLMMTGSNMFDSMGEIDLHRIDIDMELRAPGIQVKAKGNPNDGKMSGLLRADLAALFQVASPFFPKSLQPETIRGTLTCKLDASRISAATTFFDLRVDGDRIYLNKSPWNRDVGPLDFQIHHNGRYDSEKGTLFVENGEIRFLNVNHFSWHGRLYDLKESNPGATVEIGSLLLDLSSLLNPAAPFLPKRFFLDIPSGMQTKGRIALEHASITGNLKGENHRVQIKGLRINVPSVRAHVGSQNPVDLSIDHIDVNVLSLESVLSDFFPNQLKVHSRLAIDRLDAKGENPILIKGFQIPELHLSADKIRQVKSVPLGITALFSLIGSFRWNEAMIPPFIRTGRTTQHIDMTGTILPGDMAELTLNKHEIIASEPKIAYGDLAFFPSAIRLSSKANGIRLKQLHPLNADIDRIQSNLKIDDDALKLDLETGFSDFGKRRIASTGKMAIDLKKLFSKIKGNKADEERLTGQIDLLWNAAGRFSADSKPANQNLPLAILSNPLPDHLHLTCRFENITFSRIPNKQVPFYFGTLSTTMPLEYAFDGKTGKGKIGASFLIKKIDSDLFLGNKQPLAGKPIDLAVSISGEHHRLNSMELAQSLVIEPFGISQTFRSSIYGLERILFAKNDVPLVSWLNELGGNGRVTVRIPEAGPLSGFFNGIRLQGKMSAEAEAELIPKKSLTVKGWTESDGLDITIGESASIEDLNINFGFQKHYTVFVDPAASTPGTRLSVKVMEENLPVSSHVNPEKDVISSLSGQWQKRLGKNHTFSLTSARIGKAPQSLHMRKTVADLELEEGIPKITYFESGLLGGAVIGSASVFEKGADLFLRIRTSFSALNPGMLLQGTDNKPDSEDLTISGRISVLAPLSVRLPSILKELDLDLQFNHIGPGATREMLHILDPHEHNETIISIRRLLRTGIPRWIEINVKNGILSLNGEVIIKGIPIKIPSLERLNLSDISGLDRYEKELRGLMPLIDILTLASRRNLPIK